MSIDQVGITLGSVSCRPTPGLAGRLGRPRRPVLTPEAMRAYLEWQYGLVAQLGRDGTHGFSVLLP